MIDATAATHATATHATVVSYLEMTERPIRPRKPAPLEKLALLRAEACSVSYYRYLYAAVGEPWLWWSRRTLSDAALAAIVQDPRVEIYVAYVAGVPAGYCELDRRDPATVDLSYFGLLPEFIGRGLGPWMMEWAVEAAWIGAGIQRLTVNTCTFDHPRALLTYQRAGFRLVRQVEKVEVDPRLTGLLPRTAAPHVPLADGSSPA